MFKMDSMLPSPPRSKTCAQQGIAAEIAFIHSVVEYWGN
jgi:hypothetical protein